MVDNLITPTRSQFSWLDNINWGKIAKFAVEMWIFIHVVLITVIWYVGQRSEQGAYISTETYFFNEETWYPDNSELYLSHIQAAYGIDQYLRIRVNRRESK